MVSTGRLGRVYQEARYCPAVGDVCRARPPEEEEIKVCHEGFQRGAPVILHLSDKKVLEAGVLPLDSPVTLV